MWDRHDANCDTTGRGPCHGDLSLSSSKFDGYS